MVEAGAGFATVLLLGSGIYWCVGRLMGDGEIMGAGIPGGTGGGVWIILRSVDFSEG